MSKQTIKFISKLTKKEVDYPSNSNRARKEAALKSGKVISSGQTYINPNKLLSRRDKHRLSVANI